MKKNEKEKYAAYLCSREWNVLKEAVHKRAGGICERCKLFPIDSVHHLTYERKYREDLADLQGVCSPCHKFTHGLSEFDPVASREIAYYLNFCNSSRMLALPVEAISPDMKCSIAISITIAAITQIRALLRVQGSPQKTLLDVVAALDASLPCSHPAANGFDCHEWDHADYASALAVCPVAVASVSSFEHVDGE